MSARYDFFVSHSSDDKARVEKIVNYLEGQGFRCFLSSRLGGGERWNEEIQDALVHSYALLLILSQSSREKQYVANEVAIAVDEKIKLLPFRIDKVDYGPLLRIHCVSTQWVDGHGHLLKSGLETLCRTVPQVGAIGGGEREELKRSGPSALQMALEDLRMRLKPRPRHAHVAEGGQRNRAFMGVALLGIAALALITLGALVNRDRGPASCGWTEGPTRVTVGFEERLEDSDTPPQIRYDSPCSSSGIALSVGELNGTKCFRGDIAVPGDGTPVTLLATGYPPKTIDKNSQVEVVAHE